MNKILLGCLVALLAGCALKPLTMQERSVRILRKSDAPSNCSEVGNFVVDNMEYDYSEKQDQLKRYTYEAGGNVVSLDARDGYGSIAGTGYKCP